MLRKKIIFVILALCVVACFYYLLNKTIGIIHFLIIFAGTGGIGYLNYLEVLQIKEDLFRRVMKEAEDAYKHKQPSNAIKHFNIALKMRPGALEIFMGLAQCHRMLMQYELALKDLENATLSEPSSFQPFFLSGMILLQMNKPHDALRFFLKTEKANPEFVDVYFLMGQINEKSCEWREALRCYENYVQKNGPFKGEVTGKIQYIRKKLGIEDEPVTETSCTETEEELDEAPVKEVDYKEGDVDIAAFKSSKFDRSFTQPDPDIEEET